MSTSSISPTTGITPSQSISVLRRIKQSLHSFYQNLTTSEISGKDKGIYMCVFSFVIIPCIRPPSIISSHMNTISKQNKTT